MCTPLIIEKPKDTLNLTRDIDFCFIALGMIKQKPGIWYHSEPKQWVGWTINVPTTFKIKTTYKTTYHRWVTDAVGNVECKPHVKTVVRSVPFHQLPERQQQSYLYGYVTRVVTPNVDSGAMVFERTKKGNVHVHILARLLEGSTIETLRQAVCVNSEVQLITKGNAKKQIYLNYIHYLDKGIDDWCNYLCKSQTDETPKYYF